MVTKSMRGHEIGKSQEQNAIYEALLKVSPALDNFKAKPYKQHYLTKTLTTATGIGRTVKMEVEYLSEMSESLY